jgi:hypothetical protein
LLLPTPLTIAVLTAKAEQTYQRDIERVGGPTWQAVLAVAERKWPTPICRDSRTVQGGARTMNALGSEPLITQVAQAEGATDGALNPMWVEWLMGWPLGWTDLKPLATDKSPSVPLRHGECLLEAEA